jgi:DNA polymerase-3 subunit beta
MKVTVERAQLLKSLGHVHRVVERRNTIPILGNVLIRAENARLSLKATDLDLEVTESLPADVATGGSTTVPAHMFYDIVRKLPDGSQIVLEGERRPRRADDPRRTFNASRCRLCRKAISPTSPPANDAFFRAQAGRREATDRQARSSRSRPRRRATISTASICTPRNPGPRRQTLRAVATDGHRLAQRRGAAAERRQGHAGRHRAAQDRGRGAAPDRGQRGRDRIELSQSKIRFTLGDIVLTSKLIDGTFPDYGRVIPQNNDKQLTVDKKDFEAAVDRVSTISSERGRAVKLAMSAGKLVLSVTNPDSGSATEELEVDYGGDALDIGFNSRYLLDIAAQIESEVALLKLADPGSPTLIQDKESKGALYVLMPMRV